jgi:hypothetical protein
MKTRLSAAPAQEVGLGISKARNECSNVNAKGDPNEK